MRVGGQKRRTSVVVEQTPEVQFPKGTGENKDKRTTGLMAIRTGDSSDGKEPAANAEDGVQPWVGKITWRRKW